MAFEIYDAPIDESSTISLETLVKRLSEKGLVCSIEPDLEEMYWVSFGGYDSTILASLNGDQFVFATLQVSSKDDPSLFDQVERVMFEAGYSGCRSRFWNFSAEPFLFPRSRVGMPSSTIRVGILAPVTSNGRGRRSVPDSIPTEDRGNE